MAEGDDGLGNRISEMVAQALAQERGRRRQGRERDEPEEVIQDLAEVAQDAAMAARWRAQMNDIRMTQSCYRQTDGGVWVRAQEAGSSWDDFVVLYPEARRGAPDVITLANAVARTEDPSKDVDLLRELLARYNTLEEVAKKVNEMINSLTSSRNAERAANRSGVLKDSDQAKYKALKRLQIMLAAIKELGLGGLSLVCKSLELEVSEADFVKVRPGRDEACYTRRNVGVKKLKDHAGALSDIFGWGRVQTMNLIGWIGTKSWYALMGWIFEWCREHYVELARFRQKSDAGLRAIRGDSFVSHLGNFMTLDANRQEISIELGRAVLHTQEGVFGRLDDYMKAHTQVTMGLNDAKVFGGVKAMIRSGAVWFVRWCIDDFGKENGMASVDAAIEAYLTDAWKAYNQVRLPSRDMTRIEKARYILGWKLLCRRQMIERWQLAYKVSILVDLHGEMMSEGLQQKMSNPWGVTTNDSVTQLFNHAIWTPADKQRMQEIYNTRSWVQDRQPEVELGDVPELPAECGLMDLRGVGVATCPQLNLEEDADLTEVLGEQANLMLRLLDRAGKTMFVDELLEQRAPGEDVGFVAPRPVEVGAVVDLNQAPDERVRPASGVIPRGEA